MRFLHNDYIKKHRNPGKTKHGGQGGYRSSYFPGRVRPLPRRKSARSRAKQCTEVVKGGTPTNKGLELLRPLQQGTISLNGTEKDPAEEGHYLHPHQRAMELSGDG